MEVAIIIIAIFAWALYSVKKDENAQLEYQLNQKKKEMKVSNDNNYVWEQSNQLKKKYPKIFDIKQHQRNGILQKSYNINSISFCFNNLLLHSKGNSIISFFNSYIEILTTTFIAPEYPNCILIGIPNDYNEISTQNKLQIPYTSITNIVCQTNLHQFENISNIKDFYKKGIILYIGENWISIPYDYNLEKILKDKIEELS